MAGKTTEMLRQEAEVAWQQLQTVLHPDILQAPHLDWHHIHPRFILYLSREVQGMPWLNHLALLTVILSSYTKLDQRTVERKMYGLHARFRVLFPRYQIASFMDWNPIEHFPQYFNDTELEDTPTTRHEFLCVYRSSAQSCAAYFRTLPTIEQKRYQKWALSDLPEDLYRRCSRAGALLAEQQQHRKEETDAIAPHFARIRGETHLRWNQIKRLRDKYHEAVALVKSGQVQLPVSFSYEEPGAGKRLHFRLWDRYTFVEDHINQYTRGTWGDYSRKTRSFAPKKNHFFLEFVHAEDGESGTYDRDALLWFGDLLRYNLLGTGPRCGTAEEVQRSQEYLRSWGYGEEQDKELTCPFRSNAPGILVWPKTQQDFLQAVQKRAKGIIFLIEPLYAAATFGLAALDFFTTTGARNGELLQFSLDADCLYTIEVEGVQRFLVRLIPKGSDVVADYIVSTETRRNLERVGDFLAEHYNLLPGECIPRVSFNTQNGRSHSFPMPRSYLFQHNHRHFSEHAINACLRFMCHGLVIQTTEGRQIKISAHLFRHLFATHLHHVEAVPLDVIAVMLHQKNVQVTAYYAAPPWQHVLVTANSLLDKFATHLGAIEDAFVRAPTELQRQLEEAKQVVGSLNTVPGGQCTCHSICPIAFACTGCVYNVPDPDREEEIVEQEQWAFIRLDQVKKRGQGPEIVKMQALIQRCHVTRQEMQLIRTYRKDETYEPALTIERNEQ